MKHLNFSLLILLSFLLINCAVIRDVNRTEPTKTKTPTSYNLPSLISIENTNQTQESKGIKISCAGNEFESNKSTKTEYTRLKSGLIVVNNEYPYEKRTIPYYTISPEKIMFKIKVQNNLGRVLRLAGTVVSINVEGKMVSLDKNDYEEFLQGIVLPRQEMEFTIYGPKIGTLKDPSTIGIFLFDLVTNTDAAGNPTERTNFEWYYQYKTEKITKEVNVLVEEVFMTTREAQRLGAK